MSDRGQVTIAQLVNQAVASTEVVDIQTARGLDRPDISILSDYFLAQLQNMAQKTWPLRRVGTLPTS